jgi:D-Tyr-tRNAtyr deacylase
MVLPSWSRITARLKKKYQHAHSCIVTIRQVKNGVFGAMMNVELVNDGPVTIVLVHVVA